MMKYLLILFTALVVAATATAQQRLQFGLRAGIGALDHSFVPVEADGTLITPGGGRVAFDAGFVLRFNLTRHLHLQAEANYLRASYAYRLSGLYDYSATLRTERIEIPVEVGFRFARVVRLFAGAVFQVAEGQNNREPSIVQAHIGQRSITLIGGAGVELGRFFLDFRITGFPGSDTWDTFTMENGAPHSTRARRSVTYGGSVGFFF